MIVDVDRYRAGLRRIGGSGIGDAKIASLIRPTTLLLKDNPEVALLVAWAATEIGPAIEPEVLVPDVALNIKLAEFVGAEFATWIVKGVEEPAMIPRPD